MNMDQTIKRLEETKDDTKKPNYMITTIDQAIKRLEEAKDDTKYLNYVITTTEYNGILKFLYEYKELNIYKRFVNTLKFNIIDTVKMENTIPISDIIKWYNDLEDKLFELKNKTKEDNKQDG